MKAPTTVQRYAYTVCFYRWRELGGIAPTPVHVVNKAFLSYIVVSVCYHRCCKHAQVPPLIPPVVLFSVSAPSPPTAEYKHVRLQFPPLKLQWLGSGGRAAENDRLPWGNHLIQCVEQLELCLRQLISPALRRATDCLIHTGPPQKPILILCFDPFGFYMPVIKVLLWHCGRRPHPSRRVRELRASLLRRPKVHVWWRLRAMDVYALEGW